METKVFHFGHFLRYFSLLLVIEYFHQYLRPRIAWAAKNFDSGLIFDDKSHGHKIFSKFENFTLSRNKV